MSRSPLTGALALALLALSSANLGALTYTVTNTNDSGAGSLRQAVLDANAHANVNGADMIQFAIPGTAIHTIEPLTLLPSISDPVVIDGYTQPGSGMNGTAVGQGLNAVIKIELSGDKIPFATGFGSFGLSLGSGSTVRGLAINRFLVQLPMGSNSRVEGCFIGTDPTGNFAPLNSINNAPGAVGISIMAGSGNQIGATFNSGRNLISGSTVANISIEGLGATGNLIQGNIIGLKADGIEDLSGLDGEVGVKLRECSGNTIGGTAAGSRNVISGNGAAGGGGGVGVFLDHQNNSNNVVAGNFIGTDASGTRAAGNGQGLLIYGQNNQIGGTAAGAGNLISGNQSIGLQIGGILSAGGTIVEGNRIGTDVTGTKPVPNTTRGIEVSSRSSTTSIGGTVPAQANVIAFNGTFGVYLPTAAPNSTGTAIRGNSIFRNGQLGIKLGTAAPTALPNDVGDGDTGANGLQNYPVISSATRAGASQENVSISGSLNSTPNTGFRIDFYADVARDPETNGEGRFYLGSTIISTNAAGDASFANVSFPYVPGSAVVSATAVAPNFDTSEFSPSRSIAGGHARLLNLSTRLRVLTGDNVLIAGFIITGSEDKRIILRGIGPSLAAQNVPDPLQDPVLEFYDQSGALVGVNDNWKDSQQAELEATGIPPVNESEAAAVGTLAPGSYTAVLFGKNNATGIGLIELYDLEQTALSELANVSTRGFVDTGDNVLIGGFFVGGPGGIAGNAKVVIRAIGPSLAAQGVPEPLQDPTLEVFNGDGTMITSNDNWKEGEQAQIQASGLAPTNDAEAAVIGLAPTGPYTAVVRGKGNTTGVGLVEVYNLKF